MIAALTAALPDLNEEAALTVVADAHAAKGSRLRELDEHLAAQPTALTSGDSVCPAVLVDLTHLLHERGHEAVVRPPCSGCGRIRPLPSRRDGDRICGACVAREQKGTCDRCGRTGTRIAARRDDGRLC
ncbi:hypothetical protein ACWEQ8_02635 [Streptomyces noursei]